MDDIIDGSTSDSSSDTTSDSTDSSQATTQPAPVDPNAGVPFHQHPRWIQRERQWQTERTQLGNALQNMQQQIRDLTNKSQSGPGLSGDEAKQYAEAAAILKKVIATDPELAQIMGLPRTVQELAQNSQGVKQLQEASVRAHHAQATARLEAMAAKEGLKTDPDSMEAIVHLVAGRAMRLENGGERYSQGDFSVLAEAFEQVKQLLGGLKKDPSAIVANKNKLKKLPTPMKSGAPAGTPAPAKPEPGKLREFEADMHTRARKMLAELEG